MTITRTGKLVFSPDVELAKLVAKNVIIKGELHIGSEECRFNGSAEIYLIGMFCGLGIYSLFSLKELLRLIIVVVLIRQIQLHW